MSVLDFRLRPGGALLCEMAEEENLIAVDPTAVQQFTDDVRDEMNQFEEEMQDRMIHIARDAKLVPAPVPQVREAVKQYDGIDCYAKLIMKLSPIYEEVLALQNLNLEVSQKHEMMNVLDQIQSATSRISNVMVPMLGKMSMMIPCVSFDDFVTSSVRPAMGFLTMHMSDIITRGLNDYTYTVHGATASFYGMVQRIEELISRDDIIRKNVVSANDVFGDKLSTMSLDQFFRTILSTDTFMNIYSDLTKSESVQSLMERSKHPGHCCGYSSGHDEFMKNVSCHIRWIMTESYSMICDLAGVGIDSAIFLNMSMRLCATVCNLFYLCTLVLFSLATEISNYVADKEAAENQILRIKNELTRA